MADRSGAQAFEVPLWRALAVFGLASLGWAVVRVAVNFRQFAHPWAGWGIIALMAARPRPPTSRPRLTERETEVLRLVAKGLSYRQVAERLVLSHAQCRTTSRTRCRSCSCTIGWSWSGTRSSRASTSRAEPAAR